MFCASQAATAICMSSEQHGVSSSTTIHLGSGPAIDRHNPIIRGSRRTVSSSATATVKKPTSTTTAPKAQKNPKTGKKSTWTKLDENNMQKKKSRDEAAAAAAERRSISLVEAARKSSCIRPSAYLTPPASKRYLLLDNNQALDKQPNTNRALALETKRVTESKSEKNGAPLFAPTEDNYCSPLLDQVVVVRVSLHCKGCAGKVKKHISRMQGFSLSVFFLFWKQKVSHQSHQL
uniref:HMA domain-containing protein n=1 Tax=Kalanchoe fedtschenkoi TaxID=63787 RepID=A0A7N0TXS7_KALFE